MIKKSAIALTIAAALHCASAQANTISGVVKDPKGQPVANAEVDIIGAAAKTRTDEFGRFTLRNVPVREVELHLAARRFGHSNVKLSVPAAGLTDVELQLTPSSFEIIDVTASPLHASVTESALPVSVLAGDRLKMQQTTSLGDTLRKEVGVHSNFHGGVTSSPIIRGLDGPRVLIMQNGLDAGDASRIGPDHSVATETSTATQIEVLRGPATLFYGSGAIGGVVNVVDERIPTDSTPRAEWLTELQSVDSAKLVAGSLVNGNQDYAVYLDGFWRDSMNYKAPHDWLHRQDEHDHDHDHDHADEHGEHGRRIANTFSTSKGFTVGGSRLLDNGFVGLSYGRLEREYGIPGHSHGGEDDHAGHDEELVYADKKQDRLQLQSELFFDNPWLRQLNSRLAYTDYQHAEIEEEFVSTVFRNKSHEARFELFHQPVYDWKGGLSLHYKFSDFEAVGSEAFTPPSESTMLALGWMAERHFGPVLLQLGARAERVKISADRVLLPELEIHGLDDDHHDHDHGHDHGGVEIIRVFGVENKYTPVSLSAGVVWDFAEGYNLGLSLSQAERAPSTAELFSFGPHLGTRSYEIGSLFRLNADRDGFELNRDGFALEKSRNLDLTFRKFGGDFGLVLNAFYNRVDNYFYQRNTGLFAEYSHQHEDEHDGHDHGDHDHGGHDHGGELPVYLYVNEDVDLQGFEAQFIWQISAPYRLTVQGDYIRARLRAGGELPRTPPMRLMTELAYQGNHFDADLSISRYFRQDKTAEFEQASAGYTLVDASVSYRFNLGSQDLVAYLKAQNLTDELALVHTSFLRDITPLPGRSFAIGLRGSF